MYFFPHILDVKLFLLFEVLERSNAKNSNQISVPVLDVGNQKSLFVLVFLVMPSWDSVTKSAAAFSGTSQVDLASRWRTLQSKFSFRAEYHLHHLQYLGFWSIKTHQDIIPYSWLLWLVMACRVCWESSFKRERLLNCWTCFSARLFHRNPPEPSRTYHAEDFQDANIQSTSRTRLNLRTFQIPPKNLPICPELPPKIPGSNFSSNTSTKLSQKTWSNFSEVFCCSVCASHCCIAGSLVSWMRMWEKLDRWSLRWRVQTDKKRMDWPIHGFQRLVDTYIHTTHVNIPYMDAMG